MSPTTDDLNYNVSVASCKCTNPCLLVTPSKRASQNCRFYLQLFQLQKAGLKLYFPPPPFPSRLEHMPPISRFEGYFDRRL